MAPNIGEQKLDELLDEQHIAGTKGLICHDDDDDDTGLNGGTKDLFQLL